MQPAEDYVLEVTVPGFTPIRQTGIKVRVGQATPADINLTVMTESQPVATFQIIEKVNPVLSPDTAQSGVVITAEKAGATPIFNQAEHMSEMVAGVSGVADGSGRMSTRGGLKRFTKMYVDGLDTTDITDSGITSPVNFDAVENFEILSGGLDAQYNSLGMITNLVTKSGSNKFTYDFKMLIDPTWMSASNKIAGTQSPFLGTYTNNDGPSPGTSFYGPAIGIGGPIIKDKLFYYL